VTSASAESAAKRMPEQGAVLPEARDERLPVSNTLDSNDSKPMDTRASMSTYEFEPNSLPF